MTTATSSTANPLADLFAERVRAGRLPSPGVCRGIRLAAGLTLAEVAAAVPVNVVTLGRWERGEARPKPAQALAYRQVLDALQEAVDREGDGARDV